MKSLLSNYFSKDAPHTFATDNMSRRLIEKYGTNRKLEWDKLNEPVIWAQSPEDAKSLIQSFIGDDYLKIDFLSDLTAYDNCDLADGNFRFVVVYQLYSTEKFFRIRIKLGVQETQPVLSITDLLPAANWLEREVFDMFGISFSGHPNLRRILMDERFTGHPLRKEYPIKQREPFKDNIRIHLGANPMHVESQVTEDENSSSSVKESK